MTTDLNCFLGTNLKINVVDIGANPIDSTPPYAPLLQSGHAHVLGFEPQPEALASLNQKKGPNETYLPFAIGDGKEHTLHFCAASGMTSLFKPNPAVINLLHGFPEWSQVLKTEVIKTARLDDIPEAAHFDYLKIDVQGAELMIFENAASALQSALVVQTEVEFMPLYIDQPLFADVDQFLRKCGFVLHRFDPIVSRVLKPLIVNKDIHAGLSQIFWTDAIYIRDFSRLELMTPEQLLRLAIILNDCYHSVDVVLHLLLEYDRRSGTRYGPRFQNEGLKVQAV